MFELMYEAKGIGLAANQVALPFRFFIINVSGDPDLSDQEHVFINPEISNQSGLVEGEEGCLSVPQLYGQVKRFETITVEAYDLDGQGFAMDLDELPARVVQHETDHL
ncbi:MAG TPA: peptide deformylase, partial [Planctomycetaceae bacterium]|nr:peptide deformylase [Planctomycetaceae bacterium]